MNSLETAEQEAASEQPRTRSLKEKLLGYSTLAALVSVIGVGGYEGYEFVDGSVSSNHQQHQAMIKRYDNCEIYVNKYDDNHDGVARVEFEKTPKAVLQACGFSTLWTETTKNLNDRKNMLDSWVVSYGLTGKVQLPSRLALEDAVKQERQASHDYAFSKRGSGVIVGALAGFVLDIAGSLSIVAVGLKRSEKKALKQEVAAGPYDWFKPPEPTRLYDWADAHNT